MSLKNDVKTLHSISNDVLDLLGKYPEHTQTVRELVVTFTAGTPKKNNGKTVKDKDKKSSSKASSLKDDAPKSGEQSSPNDKTNVNSTPTKKIPEGSILITDFADDKSNFAACVLSGPAKAARQKNATFPRMDHQSIKKRVSGARKASRKVLKEYKDESNKELKLYAGMCLINSMKHFRLVLSDAQKARVDYVNIGADLLTNFISVRDFIGLDAEVSAVGYVKNETTLFWEDPNSVGPRTSSPGTESEIKNPFA